MTKRGFIKYASVNTLAIATNDGDSFNKKASYESDTSQSAYLNNITPIDLSQKLALVAEAYDISADPSDYIFEAIRGNTSNVPNENKDAFHKTELLRFDHRLGKQVYRTYENKPHHINHRAENPKNARGFVVDAHYNDSSPPLDICPNTKCENKTASSEGRDPETGIHCRKCGTVVKDEFVELLVAIDTAKDPTFAEGVMSGVLKHGSMGCSCLRTRCNVCNNVAYSRSEFCAHIRNKGKEYDDTEPNFNPIAFVITDFDNKTAALTKKARAFEWCEGVIYDEYSRVHDPADPKAESYEMLKLQARVAQLSEEDKLRNESEILTIQSRLAQLEKTVQDKINSISKAAQVNSDVNIDISEDPEEVQVESDQPLEETPDLGTPIGELTPSEMGLTPTEPGGQMSPPAAGMAQPGAGAPPPPPGRRGGSKESKPLSRALDNLGGSSMLRFANSYKHLNAEVTDAGNVRVYDKEGTLFAVKPDNINDKSKIADKRGKDLAKAVLTMIADTGIGGTIRRTNAIVGPRLNEMLTQKTSQVADYYQDDMSGKDRSQTNSALDEYGTDAQEQHGTSKETETATGAGEVSDRQDNHETKDYKGVDVLTGRDTDVEDEQHDRSPESLSSTEMHDSDKRDDRKDWNLGQSSLDDVTLDHTEKAADKRHAKDKCSVCDCDPCKCEDKTASIDIKKHATRLERLYNSRLEAKVAQIKKEKENELSSFKDRISRAMKIVAQRQALNLEFSPLKTSMGIVLANQRDLGDGYVFEPMDQHLAVNLTEAAFNEALIDGINKPAWECFIDGMLERAASIMEMSDDALMQIESDLKNIKAASVPLDAPPSPRTASSDHSEDMRRAMVAGNLQLNPNATSEEGQALNNRDNKRNSIRQAVGTTKVASNRSSLGF